VAQQKPTTSKPTAGRTPEQKNTSSHLPSKFSRVEKYTVKPEFWDSLLDSLPPWGDEIAAIVLIVFGIMSFLSLLNVSADATISTAWSNALRALFGYGSVVVAGGILALGVIILLPKMGLVIKFPARRILALEIGFFSLLAILHLASGDAELRALARAGQGGGYIGWALSTPVSSLFGSLTAIVFYGLLLLISISVVAGIRQTHLREWLNKTSVRLRTYGEKSARLAREQAERRTASKIPSTPAIQPASTVTPSQESSAPNKRSTTQIMRIRPDLDNIPPSQRPGAIPTTVSVKPEREELELSQPSLLTHDNLSANFNAVGTVKGKRTKGAALQVERPDGRLKRFFTVADMKETKKTAKRDSNLPPLELLQDIELNVPDEQEINNNVVLIENTLLEFEIDVDVVDVKIGPTVTQYAVQPFKETNTGEGETVVVQ
jgi:S-DNA-T family DNA segregation ATPase FtsK/SpoIIIE